MSIISVAAVMSSDSLTRLPFNLIGYIPIYWEPLILSQPQSKTRLESARVSELDEEVQVMEHMDEL